MERSPLNMAITNTYDQAIETLRHSEHTLVCFPEHARPDGIATSLGFARALEALRPGHQVDVASASFHDARHRAQFAFLPGIDRVQPTLRALHDLTLRVPLRNAEVGDVRHAVRDGLLEIRLTPTSGELSAEHVEAAISTSRYDVIVTVDCPDLPSLGSLYADHAAFFQSTPIIAIDHDPGHERYGSVNCIDLAAAACGEVGTHLLRQVAPETIDPEVATCFLTGIIAETQGFRRPTATPRTLGVAAFLIQHHAHHDDILRHLYQTKTVAQLRLWGRCLARLRNDVDRRIVWSVLAQSDFLAAGTTDADLHGIVDELLANAPEADLVLLMYEQRDRTVCVLAHAPHHRSDAAAVLSGIGGSGTQTTARVCLATNNLVEAERTVLEHVRSVVHPRTRP